MTTEEINARAKQIGDLFCGNGRCHNQQVAMVAELLKRWDSNPFALMEINAALSIHEKAAKVFESGAELRRSAAAARVPLWQKCLVQALRMDRNARRHRDRIKNLKALAISQVEDSMKKL